MIDNLVADSIDVVAIDPTDLDVEIVGNTLDRSRSNSHSHGVDDYRGIDVGNCSRCIVGNCHDLCSVDGLCDSRIDATRGNCRGGLVVV